MTAPWRHLLNRQPEENPLIKTPDERRAAINFTESPLARQGFSVVVAGVLTLSVGGLAAGPSLKKINECSHGVKLVLEDRLPPLKANKKPLDVPGSTFVTTPGLLEYLHGADDVPALIRSARSA